MTPEEADKEQRWIGMDGATAWHLIERHADNWDDIGAMMEAWKRAHVMAEREACAKTCEDLWQEEATAAANGTQEPKYHDCIECAHAIRERSNVQDQRPGGGLPPEGPTRTKG